MFGNVVVGIHDLEGGRSAVELARALASANACITLVYVEVLQSTRASGPTARADAERQQLGLQRLVRLRDEARIAGEVARIQAPSVRHGLHGFTTGRAADLLVIAQCRAPEVERALLGDNAREVLRDPPCPVAVAPAEYSAFAPLRTIGVAYDGSRASERALVMAKRIAAERDARVVAFEAIAPLVFAHDPWNVEDEIEHDLDRARQRITAVTGLEAHVAYANDAVSEIRRFGASVDLLVLGAHTFHRRDRLSERTKAQRLADDPPAPLLVLSSDGPAHRVDKAAKEIVPCSET